MSTDRENREKSGNLYFLEKSGNFVKIPRFSGNFFINYCYLNFTVKPLFFDKKGPKTIIFFKKGTFHIVRRLYFPSVLWLQIFRNVTTRDRVNAFIRVFHALNIANTLRNFIHAYFHASNSDYMNSDENSVWNLKFPQFRSRPTIRVFRDDQRTVLLFRDDRRYHFYTPISVLY